MTSSESKSTTDAEPSTIRALLHELEEEQIVNTKLHAHSCERPGAQDTGSGRDVALLVFMFSFNPFIFCANIFLVHPGDDYFAIKPDRATPVLSYQPSLANLKFSTVASVFSREVGQKCGF